MSKTVGKLTRSVFTRARNHRYGSGLIVVWLVTFLATRSVLWPSLVIAIIASIRFAVQLAWTSHQGSALMGWLDVVRATVRIMNVKRRWDRAATVAGFLAHLDKAPPFLVGLRAVGPNVSGVLDLGSSGFVVEDVVKVAGRLASTMRCGFVRVLPVPGRPSECQVIFEWTDPLSRVYSCSEIMGAPLPEDHDPLRLPVAITDMRNTLELNSRLSALFVGESGSGKSSFVWGGLAGFQVRHIPVRLRVIDPAGGVELSALREAGNWVWTVPTLEKPGADVVRYMGSNRRIVGEAEPSGGPPAVLKLPKDALRVCRPCLLGETPLFHVHSYTDRAKEAGTIVENAHTSMFTRLRAMRSRGEIRKHTPSPEEPHDLIVVDEMLLLLNLLNKGVESHAGEILTIGRKASHTIWGCSQLPQKDVLGELRDLFPQRFCFAVRTREATDIVLGPGASSAGAKAHLITDEMPGVGYRYSSEYRNYVRFRGPKIDDKLTLRIARGDFMVSGASDAWQVLGELPSGQGAEYLG